MSFEKRAVQDSWAIHWMSTVEMWGIFSSRKHKFCVYCILKRWSPCKGICCSELTRSTNNQ